MKNMSARGLFVRGWLRLAGLAWMWTCLAAWADLEATFPVLTIGTQTYKNVTVTTKAKKYIFILHSEGMANIKVADLPPDLLTNLGYAAPVAANAPATGAAGWTKQALAKIELPQVRAMDWQIAKDWSRRATDGSLRLPQPDTTTLLAILGVGLALYMFGCYCCLLLCQKAGYEPGPVIWVPVLQMIPLFRAAEMSGWWVLGCFVPGLNLLAHILWSVNMVRVRRRSMWVAVFLLLPLINVLAFLYLAFSDGVAHKEDRRVEIMTLETA